jgi:hypothetical protein
MAMGLPGGRGSPIGSLVAVGQMAVLAVALRALRRTSMASRVRDSAAAPARAASSPTGVPSCPLGDAGATTGAGRVDR